MNDPAIIGRENGGGGRGVGEFASTNSDFQICDQGLIAATAQEACVSADRMAAKEESIEKKLFSFESISAPDPVFQARSRTIRKPARNGGVSMGRCAECVMRNGLPIQLSQTVAGLGQPMPTGSV